MKSIICENCKYWVPTDSIETLEGVILWGFCHRNPPTPWRHGDEKDDYNLPVGNYPIVTHAEWCGEYKK